MIPLFKTAFEQAVEGATSLNNQAKALLDDETLVALQKLGLLSEIECTPEGMFLTPLGDPMQIVNYFHLEYEHVFTRERSSNDTYDWITVWPGPNPFNIYIVAGEVFNMSGTVVTPNHKQ